MVSKLYFIYLQLTVVMLVSGVNLTTAQVLTLESAVDSALQNYASIKAREKYVNVSRALVEQSKRDYLPDLIFSAQQTYGTVNGSTGPMAVFRGLNAASSGPALAEQNWNAAFGSLYLANINWDFFSFGRTRQRNEVARRISDEDVKHLEQERFQHKVRVTGAYLDLLAAQRLTISQERNLERALVLKLVVQTRVKNGLNPGVDSALANAEVSNTRILLTKAIDHEEQQTFELAELMGVSAREFQLDTSFFSRIPIFQPDSSEYSIENHSFLQLRKQKIRVSQQRIKYYQSLNYPTFSLFGVIQTRGSGFHERYGAQNLKAYTTDYFDGVDPLVANYLVGVGVLWNVTSPLRISQQIKAQRFTTLALQDEYDHLHHRLVLQDGLADARIRNAVDNFNEAPIQVQAAAEAFNQRRVQYKMGLTNVIDFTQSLYALNRAEIDRDIAYSNVWQALLLKAAAVGDFNLFLKEVSKQ